MERDEDFLDEIIRERSAVNPEFPALVEAALELRRARRMEARDDRASRLDRSEPQVAQDDPSSGG